MRLNKKINFRQIPIFFLTSSIENIKKTSFIIDDHLFSIRIFNRRIVFIDKTNVKKQLRKLDRNRLREVLTDFELIVQLKHFYQHHRLYEIKSKLIKLEILTRKKNKEYLQQQPIYIRSFWFQKKKRSFLVFFCFGKEREFVDEEDNLDQDLIKQRDHQREGANKNNKNFCGQFSSKWKNCIV